MNGCPGRDLLERFLNESLVDTELDGLEHHLENCASCQRDLEELSGDTIWRSGLRQEISALLEDTEPDVVARSLNPRARVGTVIRGTGAQLEPSRRWIGVSDDRIW